MPKSKKPRIKRVPKKIRIKETRKITFPLQIKSSYFSALKFVNQGNGKIPVLVKTSGATREDIVIALTKIIEKRIRKEERIIEIAKLDSKY